MNTEAHIRTTAEEIWTQTAGKVDAFICSVGTGGTLAGVSIGLKNKNKKSKCNNKKFEKSLNYKNLKKSLEKLI